MCSSIMHKNLALIILGCFCFAGCVNVNLIRVQAVEDAINSEPINAITAGCTGLGLTKDCDSYSGANRIVTLKGIKMRVAGDESGGRILLMLHENECDLGQLACKTNASNRNYHIVKSIFMENNVTIIDVKALFTGNSIVGYSFFVDDDGYSLLN